MLSRGYGGCHGVPAPGMATPGTAAFAGRGTRVIASPAAFCRFPALCSYYTKESIRSQYVVMMTRSAQPLTDACEATEYERILMKLPLISQVVMLSSCHANTLS